nr:peroxidase 20 [Tanacetum cinerariifolium]
GSKNRAIARGGASTLRNRPRRRLEAPLSYMFDVEETFGRLNLYLDYLDIDLSEYLSQAIANKIDVYVFKKIGPLKKRYCNKFSINEMVDRDEMEVENSEGAETSTRNIDKGIDATDYVKARTSTTNKGKEKVSEDATEVVETRRSIIEIDSETEYDSDDDSDYQSDKSDDYLSPGKEELIEPT